jgi:hypothetical protein
MKAVALLLLGLLGGSDAGGYDSCYRGEIRMFYGKKDYIPKGFQLCDGTNYTPDLRDKFVVGAGKKFPFYSTGGSGYFYLSVDQLPSHYHEIKADDVYVSKAGDHNHAASGDVKVAGAHDHDKGTLATADAGVHSHKFKAETNEGGHAHKFDLKTTTNGDHNHGIDFDSGAAGLHSHGDDFAVEEDGSAHDHDIKVVVKPVVDHTHDVEVDDFTIEVGGHSHGVGSYGAKDHEFTHSHTLVDAKTSTDGDHQHALSADVKESGLHSHGSDDLKTDAVADHTHSADGTLKTANAGAHAHDVAQQTTSANGEHDHEIDGYFECDYDTNKEITDLKWDKVDQDKGYPATSGTEPDHSHVVPAHTTEVAGEHMHDVKGDTSANGGHYHDVIGDIDEDGLHDHEVSVTMEQAGAHYHSVTGGTNEVSITLEHELFGLSADGGQFSVPVTDVTGLSSANGGHTHDAYAKTTSQGVHAHELSGGIKEDGQHVHRVYGNTANNGDHYHSVQGTIGGTGGYGYGSGAEDGTHSHKIYGETQENGAHNHDITGSTGAVDDHDHDIYVKTEDAGQHSHTVKGKTTAVGQGKKVEVLPPYESVYFICCVGTQSSSSSEMTYSYVDGYGNEESSGTYKDEDYNDDEDDSDDYEDKYVGYGGTY